MIVPVEARGRILGAATFGVSDQRRRFGPLDLLTARDLARRAGLALDNGILYETARRAVLARNEVLGIVSHDLRVPVNTMMATLELLGDTVPERRAEVRRWLDVLHRATDQMKALIDDLLDATRMESERFTVERAPESAAVLIGQACEMMQPVAAVKQVLLECGAEQALDKVSLDGLQILRVLGNLIGNAIKFSSAGGKIRVRAESRAGELWVSVQDEGPGIPADDLPKVFDRFWKGRSDDRRGAGLGLTIAKGIVEAHGGRIWVESEEGEGSTFTFALPLDAPAAEHTAAEAALRATPAAYTAASTSAAPAAPAASTAPPAPTVASAALDVPPAATPAVDAPGA
jgi:signal transduction histidine kinase